MIRAIIFDMDGVLVDSMKHHIDSWTKALNLHKIPATKHDIALLEGSSRQSIVPLLAKRYGVVVSEEIFSAICQEKDRLMSLSSFSAYQEVYHVLDVARSKDVRIAVVTGSTREFTEQILSSLFPSTFSHVVTGDEVSRPKPSPEPYQKALDLLGIPASEALVIENAPLGITSAKQAGIRTYALTTTLEKQHLADADKVFSSHEELSLYLEKEL